MCVSVLEEEGGGGGTLYVTGDRWVTKEWGRIEAVVKIMEG